MPSSQSACAVPWTIVVDYDAEARASYQRMSDKPVACTVERADGAIVDYAADGTMVGIERLYA